MSNECRLRNDLTSILDRRHRRPMRIVIDEIGGRFARIPERLWQRLCAGCADESLWAQADAAGWTRNRSTAPARRFSPLYFRIPIGSVDTFAARLLPISAVLFGPLAVGLWCSVILLAVVIVLTRIDQFTETLGSLALFLEQAKPWALATTVVVTKILHELGHAVMCRRMGARCGSVGILFLCGFPCAYCDVTDIWREPSRRRRAAVMLAGIYVELVLASLATFVWVATHDPVIRFHAVNMILICGISTVLFNANPLMRYDGYYVLADLIGSANLRTESQQAFRSVVVKRLLGKNYPAARRTDPRSLLLATYHALASMYRVVVMASIAFFFVAMAEWFHLRSVAIAIVVVLSMSWSVRTLHKLGGVIMGSRSGHGAGSGKKFSPRGFAFVAAVAAVLVFGVCFPMPRYRSVEGSIDAAQAETVFLNASGIIDEVHADFGEHVDANHVLARLGDESIAVTESSIKGQLRLASLRSGLARHEALQRNDSSQQWQTLQAVEDSLSARLASMQKRRDELELRSGQSGVVLPGNATVPLESVQQTVSLRARKGSSATLGQAWCRISPDGKIHAVLEIELQDRRQIDIGTPVRVLVASQPDLVFESRVVSVSQIRRDDQSLTRRGAYQVLCPLQAVPTGEMMQWMGVRCEAVFRLDRRSLAADLRNWLTGWIEG